ncbi:hypothetical protein EX30DRAFT_337973 [Ascodesmis nigricans]|uniref:GRIP domain-containing protein n=1 Tax=Ascodesmis nigricans TaxID=341454 RepID=A0A4S2N8H2_9PEZI|nr:hypothetical protein EX30DRAFT_337973 [Ascodesmis nigricans]
MDSGLAPPASTGKSKKKKKSKSNLKEKSTSSASEASTPSATAVDASDVKSDVGVEEHSTTNGSEKQPNGTAPELERLLAELAIERERREELEVQLSKKSPPPSEPSATSTQANEVAALRSELEELRETRAREKEEAESRIEEAEDAKAHIEQQYQTLRERVTQIRSTLGDRMKADAEELAQAKQTIEELEDQNRELNDAVEALRSQLNEGVEERNAKDKEISGFRTRLNLSQQNWTQERDELVSSERRLQEELESLRQALRDWEVVAMEERAVRESLEERVVELEEQRQNQEETLENTVAERDRSKNTIIGLQRALEEIQEARKKELREVVENTQNQIAALTTKCHGLETRAKAAEASLATAQADLARVLPFESQVREKDLLIGKLRHEAVTLNDHLRKAMRVLKRNNSEDRVDKQLVTNLFLQFQSIGRGDPKKYEALQVIASVLDWTDEQKEKAGLLRPGTAQHHDPPTSKGGLFTSLPLSPFHRSPSTPALGTVYDSDKVWAEALKHET